MKKKRKKVMKIILSFFILIFSIMIIHDLIIIYIGQDDEPEITIELLKLSEIQDPENVTFHTSSFYDDFGLLHTPISNNFGLYLSANKNIETLHFNHIMYNENIIEISDSPMWFTNLDKNQSLYLSSFNPNTPILMSFTPSQRFKFTRIIFDRNHVLANRVFISLTVLHDENGNNFLESEKIEYPLFKK